MNKLNFRSNILEQTNRYSKDFFLPDYLYDENGSFDRDATIRTLLSEEYGFVDAEGIKTDVSILKVQGEDAYSGVYAGFCRKHIKYQFTLSKNGRASSFPVDLFLPDTDDANRPLVVALDFKLDVEKCYCPLQEIMEQNVAIARVLYTDITSDDNDFENGVAPMLSNRTDPHSAGKLAIWAYVASIIGRYMLEEKHVKPGRLFVSGHSRLGKTSLLAAALYDDLFAGVHSNNSGCSGVAVSREKGGESIAIICERFPFWFAPKYQEYAGRECEAAFDQHYLTALIAPRKLCVATAERDEWADTDAQYLSLEAASVIYEKMGVTGLVNPRLMKTGMSSDEGQIALIMRSGPHYFSRHDWNFFLNFIKK